jgi:hypothetical protein
LERIEGGIGARLLNMGEPVRAEEDRGKFRS